MAYGMNNMGWQGQGYMGSPLVSPAPIQQPYMAGMPQYNNNIQATAQQPQAAQNMALQGRMVTSKEEALGVPVDFLGNPMYFPDLAHNTIYFKRFNANTGCADFAEFRLVAPQPQPQQNEQQPAQVPTADFVPIQDFKDLKETVRNLQNEIERLKKPTSNGKTVKKNDADE